MNNTERILVYDHSFNGFLSAVYKAFYEKLELTDIRSVKNTQGALFSESVRVRTNEIHAKKVWYALQKKNHSAVKTVYFAFLSESYGIEMLLYRYIRHLFSKSGDSNMYINSELLSKIDHMSGLVGREKQRIESELELQSGQTNLRLAYIEPAFNVLPLISKYFKSQVKDHPWIIFDLRRKYGLYCNDHGVQMISSQFMDRITRHTQVTKSGSSLSSEKCTQHVGEALENNSLELEATPSAA